MDPANPVLTRGAAGAWDAAAMWRAPVVHDGSGFHMWYTGAAGSARASIGYAVSGDGIEWTRFLGNPVVDEESGTGYEFASVIRNDDAGKYEMWFRDNSENSVYRAISDCCSTVYGSVIPAAAFAGGAEGSFYETDLDLSNAGATAADYTLTWLPRGEDNREAVQSDFFTLGAGRSVRYSNVLAEESLIVMPWSNDQTNRIFDSYHPVTGYVDFWSAAPSGRIYCYGSLLDNVTSDPTTIPPM